jgi:YVTN family beta-propeller protein
VAVTPDGKTAYVANSGSGTVTPIATATNTAGTPITVGTQPDAMAITPDGRTAYVANSGSGTVTPIATATNTAGTPITVGTQPDAIAITPDGRTAYVTDIFSGTVTPVATATNIPGTPIIVGHNPDAIAVTPDGTTVYVANAGSGTVTPVATATDIPGTPIIVGSDPAGVAITPDQAPVASFRTSGTTGVGSPVTFNASASTVAYGSITSYAWRFGDGTSATTTGPITSHRYTKTGSFIVNLTETDSAGTSTTQVFTGQTMSRNGGPRARTLSGLTIT